MYIYIMSFISESAHLTMTSLLIFNPSSLTLSPPTRRTTHATFKPPHVPNSTAIRFSGTTSGRRETRGLTVITRAGPSTSSYVFAFVFPLSLLAVTIFTSIKIANKLDRDFLQELAINEAIRQGDEEEGEDGDLDIFVEEEPALPRTRNRPKREA